MKRFFCVLSVLISNGSLAQAVRPDPVVDMTTAGVRELMVNPDEPIESVYLNDDWVNGNIAFKTKYEIKSIPIKYDLKKHILEIWTSTGIKVAGLEQIEQFEFDHTIEKQTFINSDNLHMKGFAGLAEVLVAGETALYANPHVKKIHANYNAALDVGQRSDQYIKEEKLYLIKNKEAYNITKAGKKILIYFGDKSDAIQSFVDRNNLSYKKRDDLVKIVEEYNKL